MIWFNQALQWYAMTLIIGLLFFPLARLILGKWFVDQGYAFARILGIGLSTYALFVLGVTHIFPFTILSTYGVFIGLGLSSALWALRKQTKIQLPYRLILVEELLFIVSFFSWVYVRGQEGSIHGLEKFMDYGFMQSALNGKFFPPSDMWLSGFPINYYYFGHLTGAVLIRLSQLPSDVGYNLILATILGLSVIQTFSLCFTLCYNIAKRFSSGIIGGVLGTFLLNFAGNLHTIYAFTKGYENEKPVPFWDILTKYNPTAYWYPNATRFIPFTIHEFPLYSYVVADLHGHVFDIPYVLLTLACFYAGIRFAKEIKLYWHTFSITRTSNIFGILSNKQPRSYLLFPIGIGALIGIAYMTNAFDGIVYMALAGLVSISIFGFSWGMWVTSLSICIAFLVSSLPFSLFFKPFATGIGVNCAPEMLVKLGKIGPFLFERGNCQHSPLYMLAVLWGFFVFHGIFYLLLSMKQGSWKKSEHILVGLLFFLGIACITAPEFIYLKDIYPQHFRANTMFKLGYQAFMMMSIGSAYVFVLARERLRTHAFVPVSYLILFIPLFFLVSLYPTFAIKSYYGDLKKTPSLAGEEWIERDHPAQAEAIRWLRAHTPTTVHILEAQGDSYTDLNVISAYTGRPTIAGWWVHEWLWRGSSDAVGSRIPEIEDVYKGSDPAKTRAILKKYAVDYIVVGDQERTKYGTIADTKLSTLGKIVFRSSDGSLTIYRVGIVN